jgi:secreted trypsin-like serine protease
MRTRRAAAALAALLVLALAGPTQAITFGELDQGRHPNVGSMVVVIDGVNESFCTGTLVAPKVFVTAAHCTAAVRSWYDIDPDEILVTFDAAVDQASRLYSGTYYEHPRYGTGAQATPYDLAVVVLDEAPPIAPARLPTAGLLDTLELRDQRFVAVGYGTVREDKTGGWHSLYWDPERRMAEQGFRSLTKAWLNLSMNPSIGSGGTCNGDSGGPHFLVGTDIVVSTTVTGDRYCRATDVTYRLDTPWARSFLDDFVALP